MEIANETRRAGGAAGLGKPSSLDNRDIAQNHSAPQAEKRNPAQAEFDGEIALALTASGWRSTAALLTHAAGCADAGDFLNAERSRRRARELFIEGNDAFRQFMEARAAKAAAEAYQ